MKSYYYLGIKRKNTNFYNNCFFTINLKDEMLSYENLLMNNLSKEYIISLNKLCIRIMRDRGFEFNNQVFKKFYEYKFEKINISEHVKDKLPYIKDYEYILQLTYNNILEIELEGKQHRYKCNFDKDLVVHKIYSKMSKKQSIIKISLLLEYKNDMYVFIMYANANLLKDNKTYNYGLSDSDKSNSNIILSIRKCRIKTLILCKKTSFSIEQNKFTEKHYKITKPQIECHKNCNISITTLNVFLTCTDIDDFLEIYA